MFSKLDLSHAYMQLHVALDPEAKKYVTISTQKGPHTRLPFGISSALAIFQRTMEQVLHGIPNTIAYTDDILSLVHRTRNI